MTKFEIKRRTPGFFCFVFLKKIKSLQEYNFYELSIKIYNYKFIRKVTLTKWRYPADISDNCIKCRDEIEIYPPNGNCIADCGPKIYPRDDKNQCSDCHWICYTCFSFAIDNYLSCIEDRR